MSDIQTTLKMALLASFINVYLGTTCVMPCCVLPAKQSLRTADCFGRKHSTFITMRNSCTRAVIAERKYKMRKELGATSLG